MVIKKNQSRSYSNHPVIRVGNKIQCSLSYYLVNDVVSKSVYVQQEKQDDFETAWNRLCMSICDSYPVFA